MGDAKSDPMTFGAWSMGYFGPFAYPGGLTRAIQQPWGWAAARDVAPTHRGFDRIRSSYVGPGENRLSWIVDAREEGLVAPPRRVLRLAPKADASAIHGALAAAGLSHGR